MGLCSCTPTCACAIHAKTVENGGSGLISITGNGNPAEGGWEVDVFETPFNAVNDDGTISIAPDGGYGHSPHLNMRLVDSPTVGLEATPDGLTAHVLNAPTGVGGVPTGTLLPFMGDTAPDGFLMASGPGYAGYVPIGTYGALYSVIGHRGSGGVDPGNGTFAVPYVGDRTLVGQGSWGGIGTLGGVAAVTLGVGEIPSHGHGVSDPTHGHPGTVSIANDGAHAHGAGSANDSQFVVVDDDAVFPGAFRYAKSDPSAVDNIRIPTHPYDSGGGITEREQNVRAATNTTGTHNHGGSSISVNSVATGVSILNEGGGGAHENRPPYMVTNFIIKT